jgi:hypothetical protein
MSPNRTVKFLVNAIRNRRNVLLIGDPGIGKSDVVDRASEEAGAANITKHPGVEESIDGRGLPVRNDVDGKVCASFAPFDDLFQLIHATKLTVCHLEDFGGADVAVQKAYMQALLRRQVGQWKISPEVVWIATTNDVKDQAGVQGMLEPIKSRFHTMVRMQVSLDDWIQWAIDHGMPAWLIAYMRDFPDSLHQFKPTKQLTNSPCPRTWAELGKWDLQGERDLEVWAGCVGEGKAAHALRYCEDEFSMPDPDMCIMDPHNAPLPTKSSIALALTAAMAYRMTAKNFGQISTYLLRIGKPEEVMAVQRGYHRNPSIVESTAFARWVTNPENRDIVL